MAQVEVALAHEKRAYEMLRVEHERMLASNELAAPIVKYALSCLLSQPLFSSFLLVFIFNSCFHPERSSRPSQVFNRATNSSRVRSVATNPEHTRQRRS